MQGWCNNVAWNVGPLTWFQYKVAVDRHAFYKLHRFRSIIPMIQLSWNLARNCRVMSDGRLRSLLREFLDQSLSSCASSLQCAEQFGKEVKWHGRVDGEPAHYCENCEVRCSSSVSEKQANIFSCKLSCFDNFSQKQKYHVEVRQSNGGLFSQFPHQLALLRYVAKHIATQPILLTKWSPLT